jgi:hypothetical protein
MASPVARFFGGLLIAAGVLIAFLCGGCGLAFFVGFLVTTLQSSSPEGFAVVWLPLVLGGPPAAIGVGLVFAGRALWRRGG